MIGSILLSLAGFAVSLYAYIIEVNVARNQEYKPFCDISDLISCARVVSSRYGKLVGISNALIGMAFYALIFVLAAFSASTIIFYLAIGAVLASIGLAYISFFMIKSFCILCSAIYLINVLLLIASYAGW